NNLNLLLARFGLAIAHDTVQDYDHNLNATPSWVRSVLALGERGAAGDLLAGVTGACFYRAGTISVANGADAQVLARTAASASTPGAPLAVAVRHDAGRVVALADSDLFGDDCLGDLGHEALWVNLVSWAGARAYARGIDAAPSAAAADLRAWADGGFAKPGFTASLELFRPDRARRDGIEHLVLFPMYLQNGRNRDVHFAALIV